jgi:hypothetical protein
MAIAMRVGLILEYGGAKAIVHPVKTGMRSHCESTMLCSELSTIEDGCVGRKMMRDDEAIITGLVDIFKADLQSVHTWLASCMAKRLALVWPLFFSAKSGGDRFVLCCIKYCLLQLTP